MIKIVCGTSGPRSINVLDEIKRFLDNLADKYRRFNFFVRCKSDNSQSYIVVPFRSVRFSRAIELFRKWREENRGMVNPELWMQCEDVKSIQFTQNNRSVKVSGYIRIFVDPPVPDSKGWVSSYQFIFISDLLQPD